ncbi:MAG: long-chain fatty acid--CoA ligase [Bacteroidota bacterium]
MSVLVPFSTIPEMFDRLTEKLSGGERPSLMVKKEGKYVGISYAQLREDVKNFALGLASAGLKRGDRVAIIGENRPEWVIADQAVAVLGAVSVPVYPTMNAKQTEFIFRDAGVRFAIVSNQFQYSKVARFRDSIRSLELVILMADRGSVEEPRTTTLPLLKERGLLFGENNPDYLDLSRKMVRGSDLLTIIYTSGTTGEPKGVMLSHTNLVTNIISAASVIDFGPTDVILSFLPLSHSFERMAGYYTAMACGGTIAYAESVETVRDDMVLVRPTIITTVPRLFERIHAKVLKQAESGPAWRRRIFHWAVNKGREAAAARRRGFVSPVLTAQLAIADALVFSKLRERTGGRIRYFVSGGAALSREFGEFFEAAGLIILEGYGLTESSPVIAVSRLAHYKFGSVGQPIPGVEVKIAEDGEILARGPNIMQGYWKQPDATAQMIDRDHWLHTGDIGVLDEAGFLYITDRKKNLFVSSGGKNIAPQPIENLFMSSRFIEQFMLIGDRRTYLTALIVPDYEALRDYADANNITYTTNRDLAEHAEINALIDRDIATLQKELSSYERVRKFTLLDKPFSIEDGELTPSQKVRRKVVEERYAHLIEGMYKM